jgi:PPOX class probable F420-dependent enzyme
MAKLSRTDIAAYLKESHVAHMVTVRPDGRPHVAPVWFLEEDGRAFVIADADAVRVRNIQHNFKVALSIATDQRPFKYVVLEGEGRVINQDLSALVERICVRYDGPERGRAYAAELLSEDRTRLVDIRVTRVIGWKDDD